MNMPATPHCQLLTFDVYTALADVEGSLTPVLRQKLPADVNSLDLVRTWRRKQLEYALISNSFDRERVPFETITRRALDYTLGQAKVVLSDAARQELVVAWEYLRLWPEAEYDAGRKDQNEPRGNEPAAPRSRARILGGQLTHRRCDVVDRRAG